MSLYPCMHLRTSIDNKIGEFGKGVSRISNLYPIPFWT